MMTMGPVLETGLDVHTVGPEVDTTLGGKIAASMVEAERPLASLLNDAASASSKLSTNRPMSLQDHREVIPYLKY
jgi:hypothetical protein